MILVVYVEIQIYQMMRGAGVEPPKTVGLPGEVRWLIRRKAWTCVRLAGDEPTRGLHSGFANTDDEEVYRGSRRYFCVNVLGYTCVPYRVPGTLLCYTSS